MMLVSAVIVAIMLVFATKTASTDLDQEQVILTDPVYYDCGSSSFYEHDIQEMLSIPEGKIIKPFVELLYDLEPSYRKVVIPMKFSRSNNINFKNQESIFYAIISLTNQIVDVVAEMKNGHYIKCNRVVENTPKHMAIDENTYGFECGHEVFSYEIAKMSAAIAYSNIGKTKFYPVLYQGPLYRPELNYWIYPLSRENRDYQPSRLPENTYFVVISPSGELIDMIVQLVKKSFMKCNRTTKVPSDFYSDDDLRNGYTCGIEFFDIDHLRKTVELAKARKLWNKRKLKYPKPYDGPPFYGGHLLFPLFPNGRFYGNVPQPFLYFVVMNLDFEVKHAVMTTKKGMKPCEESIRGIEIARRETDNFKCEDRHFKMVFENTKLMETVEVACKALGARNRMYPAYYEGPEFNVQGPYLTMPIRNKNSLMGSRSKYRVVLNAECMLAGVIANFGGKFYKCKRSKDNSIPGGESEEPITERFRYKPKKRSH